MASQFVCVRMQSMNGVNLNAFPFERDLTWMAFFQNAEGRTYARYGGRGDHGPESHLNRESLLWTMRQVLERHKKNDVQPDNKYEPVAKTTRVPMDHSAMRRKMANRKDSCIHCHDIKAADLEHNRRQGRLQKYQIYTYPSPSRLGVHLDTQVHNKIKSIDRRSPAATAGLRAGDVLKSVDQQRVLTFADVTRVLELAPETGTVTFEVERAGQTVAAKIRVTKGWRKNVDASWRPSTGSVGPSTGIWGKRVPDQQRRQYGLSTKTMAVRVTYIWSKWAKGSGIRHNDIVIALNGYKADVNMRQLAAHLHLTGEWGDRFTFTVLRGGRKMDIKIQLPNGPPNG